MLNNWAGDHGFLHKLNVSVRRPNLVGDTIWWQGTVTNKRVQGTHHVVDLDVVAVNQNDERSAFGTATVVLPSSEAGPVSLPLPETLAPSGAA
ncbi:MAG: hypothetical protein HOI95_07960 [Chromatiales bacterium]|nr:hypothetical protein [Chromatiales bacterium]